MPSSPSALFSLYLGGALFLGHGAVRVAFNPAVVRHADLLARTQPKGVTACQKNEGFRPDNEPKHYLSKTDYRYVPLTSQFRLNFP